MKISDGRIHCWTKRHCFLIREVTSVIFLIKKNDFPFVVHKKYDVKMGSLFMASWRLCKIVIAALHLICYMKMPGITDPRRYIPVVMEVRHSGS